MKQPVCDVPDIRQMAAGTDEDLWGRGTFRKKLGPRGQTTSPRLATPLQARGWEEVLFSLSGPAALHLLQHEEAQGPGPARRHLQSSLGLQGEEAGLEQQKGYPPLHPRPRPPQGVGGRRLEARPRGWVGAPGAREGAQRMEPGICQQDVPYGEKLRTTDRSGSPAGGP